MDSLDIMIKNLPYLLKSLPVTLFILFTSVLIAFALALLLTFAKLSKNTVAKSVAGIYISFMRGTPMVVQILLVFIGLPILLRSWGINTGTWNNIIYAIIAFSINEAAFFSEIFRSAYLAIDKGQIEAGQSMGMSSFEVFRRIIFPQAAASALPNTTNMIIELMKNTSLGLAIGVVDMMGKANQLALNKYGVGQLEIFITVSFLYWIISLIFIIISNMLTLKLNKGNVTVQPKKTWFESLIRR